ERLMKEWEPRLKAGRERAAEGRPAIVVATQTIEVGADFDFDGLVSEVASWDALCQRFGRLNRRGDTDGARGVIVAPVRPPTEDPIYGSAPAAVAAFLKCVGPEIDFSPRNLVELADDVPDAAVSQPTQGPLLTQAMIELFAQTSPLPNPDPDPAYFLHGFGPVEPEVQIVFRSGLPERATTESVSKVQSILSALPPIAAEVLSLPRRAFLHWMRMLEGEREVGEEVVADLEGRAVPEAMSTRSPGRRIWVWTGDDVRIESAASIGPGAVGIVPCRWGGWDAYGFHSEWTEPVSDIAEVALACNESRNRRLRIVLMPERVSCVPWLCPDTDTDAALLRKRIEVALEEIAAANGSPDHIAKRLL